MRLLLIRSHPRHDDPELCQRHRDQGNSLDGLFGWRVCELAFIGLDGAIDTTLPHPSPHAEGDFPTLAASGDTAVWVGAVTNYRFDLITPDGTVLTSVERQPEWLEGASLSAGTPKVNGLRELPDGLLMVLMSVADPRFDPNAPRRSIPIEEVRSNPVYDSIVEVIDPARGELLATARYDEVLRFVRGSDYLYLTREDEDGELSFEIYEPQLRR